MASTFAPETLSFPRRAQHDALRELRLALDDAVTSPALDEAARASELTALLLRMDRIFARHVQETEAVDGSLSEILHMKPHLGSRVHRVKDEHTALGRRIAGLCDALQRYRLAPQSADLRSLLSEAAGLSDAIRVHQARGIDLVYEAFNREEGAG